MSSKKRKRHPASLKCVLFPDDAEKCAGEARGAPALSSSSSARSWERCGDSFLDSPGMKVESLKSSGRKLSALKDLVRCSSPGRRDEDPVHIAWSSSDSGQSGDETQERQRGPQRAGGPAAPPQACGKAPSTLGTDEDDLPVIDTDSDRDVYEEDSEKDSGQQISDCESAPSDEKPKPTNVTELENSGYVSDGDNAGDTMTLNTLDADSSPLQTGEGSKRSVSDWVRSAHAMLQTPQKLLHRQSKSPEDSAKKRRKFQSGGLAERLNRLQCRQRSAISFWRHQSISDTSAAATVDRPGVLVLKVLEVQEECSMQLVRCEHHQSPGEGHQHSRPLHEGRARTLVLFNRETAAQLSPAPRDIIHIYPPWQNLSTESFSSDIILNTHFSQKVVSASEPAGMPIPRCLLSASRCTPYSLCRTFGLLEVCSTTGENNAKQIAFPDGLGGCGGSGVIRRHCLSLLEAIEGLGQAGCVGQDVVVVVQRVYSIPVPDCSPASLLKPRFPSKPSSAPPPAGKGKSRLCVLVQDSHGMFSEVQLHLLPCQGDLHRYCQLWQGKTCALRGIKVVQRVTRERRTRLFSLIDCLWPPAMPLKYHGNTPSLSSSHPPGPAPSFCYLLSGQESSVEPTEGQTLSPLYLPPAQRPLRDILQSELKTFRCSFIATVIFKRVQNCDVGQSEVWLVLTDPSLQDESLPEGPCRRTVALCVNTSCVLTSSVLKALNSPAACRMSFRDAIKEHGVLLCAEHSVVEMCIDVQPESSVESTAGPPPPPPPHPLMHPPPQPVRLDPLGLEITPNSLCSLTGVIVGVDENTAYSWPACNHCGSENLEMLPQKRQSFHCVSCKSAVDRPATKIQLEVFLSSASLRDCTIKVKLQEKTIKSILNATALEADEFPGYDVENVLGKEVGPMAVYVRVVTRKPALWVCLEEICL